MFTLKRLEQKLSAWREKFKTARPNPSPILLYQACFAFFHDLKNSMQLSADASIVALLPTVNRIDELLRPLAYAELELESQGNEKLLKAAATLTALESLETLLTGILPNALALSAFDAAARFPQGYGWDALAKARAASAFRHGFKFVEKTVTVPLARLVEHDTAVETELTALGGFAVARALVPKPQGAQGKDLHLEIRQLAALPAAAPCPAGWNAL